MTYQIWYQLIIPEDPEEAVAASCLETLAVRVTAAISELKNLLPSAITVVFEAPESSGAMLVSCNRADVLQSLPLTVAGFARDNSKPYDPSIPAVQVP